MGIDTKTLALANTHTDESIRGYGVQAGKNCQVTSTTPIEGGTKVTFGYYDDNQVKKESSINVMDGKDGSVVNVEEILKKGTKIAIITIDGTPVSLYAPTGGGGSSTLDGLEDVDLTNPSDGQVLVYDIEHEVWKNTNLPTASTALESLTDVDLDSPASGQVLKYDGEKWVNGEGGGGDASLESAVTSNLAVGAIASGVTLAKGTTFTEFVQKLLITEIAPTIGFSITKSGNVVYGGSYTETLTVSVSAMGTAKKIKKIEWYEGSTLKQTDTIDSTTTGSWTYTMGTATTDTTTFKAIVTYTKSSDADVSVTKTASINFYYNKFYGAVSDLNPTEATVEALTTALGTGKGGTYSFTTSASRICYAYPKSLGALTSIKDGNGFSLFDSFTRTEQTYTQNGTNVAYYRYVLTDPTTVANYSVIFA